MIKVTVIKNNNNNKNNVKNNNKNKNKNERVIVLIKYTIENEFDLNLHCMTIENGFFRNNLSVPVVLILVISLLIFIKRFQVVAAEYLKDLTPKLVVLILGTYSPSLETLRVKCGFTSLFRWKRFRRSSGNSFLIN